MNKARVPLLFGTMTLGEEGKNGARNHEMKECQSVLDTFFSHGYTELDTARAYSEGTTEQYLGRLNLKNATVDTKVWPYPAGGHEPSALRKTFHTSLQALNKDKVRVFYLHAPDRSIPFVDTLRECNKLYEEGKFEILGLSNYAAWEVAEIVGICKTNNWVQPKIYQAMYNAITRSIEPELVPCCRKFGLRVVIYNPLAGGMLAGKMTSAADAVEPGSRFDASKPQGVLYRGRYVKEGYFRSLELLKRVAEEHKLRLTEIALRWCQHHSILTPEDGIILGASSAEQLEQNIVDSEKGPLPEEVVKALDEARNLVGLDVSTYWR